MLKFLILNELTENEEDKVNEIIVMFLNGWNVNNSHCKKKNTKNDQLFIPNILCMVKSNLCS